MNNVEQTELDELRSGGSGALARIFEQHRGRLERIVLFRMDRRMYGRVDVGDVLQDAYLNAAERLDSYLLAPQADVFVWLRGITSNTLTDLHRRHLDTQARNATRELSIDSDRSTDEMSLNLHEQIVSNWTSASRVAMRSEATALIRQAVADLDDVDREVLALRHYEQLSNAEVCQVLSLSKTAASNRYMRALGRLKTLMDALSSLGASDS